tara:strand:- start:116 stop:781 length:666 start_codon:yes stop_codon:yes gene_type:complete
MQKICLVLCGAFILAGGEVWSRDGARLPGEIKLANGTVVARAFEDVSEARVRFAQSLEGLVVRGEDVARLVFSPLAAVERIPNRRTGVLLRSGDFVDGEFAGLKDGRITISSVLFGKKEFVVEEEAVAVVLHPVRKRTAAFEGHCADGSVLRVSGLKLAPAGERVDVPAACKFVVPAKTYPLFAVCLNNPLVDSIQAAQLENNLFFCWPAKVCHSKFRAAT